MPAKPSAISQQPSTAPSPCHGFTLLELIIALTITAMVVVVIYASFALGVRVWERQGSDTEEVRREEAMLRLLERDFAGMAPYTTLWEGASLAFFAGGAKTLFYVTRNGFGALRRQDKALFFVCLFVDQGLKDPEQMGVYLYKVPEPQPGLLREVRRFQASSEAARAVYLPPEALRHQAVRIAEGFDVLDFSFAADTVDPFAGPPGDRPGTQALREPENALELEAWVSKEWPQQVQMLFSREGDEPLRLLLVPGRGAL
ncbi:type II secretion system protein J [Desulfonatronum sp. SC1]|uniref:PulJ/GspJ family protein n=1 Tax=Desulfonatronum sp. SC1 TaxID=2109626 RepID=UPI001304D130|nr:prepilin-type N-terminal cleavage/methylation domain-containing protein [Desulfonatronum sp. SC1]